MLVDSHAHLESAEFAPDLDEVIGRARRAGVGEMLNVGYDAGSIAKTIDLTERYDDVYAALGIHPHNAKDFDAALEKDLEALNAAMGNPAQVKAKAQQMLDKL